MLRKITKATMRCRFESGKRNHDVSISIRNTPRMPQKGSSRVRVADKKNRRSYAKLDTKFEILEGKITVDLPIKTVSEANCFEAWQKKYGRHKDQKRAVSDALEHVIAQIRLAAPGAQIRLPCKIMLTRFAPYELDIFDNLPMSFKYIVDAICAIITGDDRPGKADSDKRITISCQQVDSKAYGIRIEITH